MSKCDLDNTIIHGTNSTQTHISHVDSESVHNPPFSQVERQLVRHPQNGVVKRNPKYALMTNTSFNAEPKNLNNALINPVWLEAMREIIRALDQNKTWGLVPRTYDMNVVGSKWIFKTKFKSDGSVERYKARLVAQGNTQVTGIDFDKTFTPVSKPTTVHIAVINHWCIQQLDVKHTFFTWFS